MAAPLNGTFKTELIEHQGPRRDANHVERDANCSSPPGSCPSGRRTSPACVSGSRTPLANLPPRHARVIRPFAEWDILRDARHRAEKGRYTAGAAANDRTDIRTAIKFMTWLDDNSITFADLSQKALDVWLTSNSAQTRGLAAFIRWAVRPPPDGQGHRSVEEVRAAQPIPAQRRSQPAASPLPQRRQHAAGGPHHRLPDQPLRPAHHTHRRAHDRPLPPGRRRRLPHDRPQPRFPAAQARRSHRAADRQSQLPHFRAPAAARRHPGFLFPGCLPSRP